MIPHLDAGILTISKFQKPDPQFTNPLEAYNLLKKPMERAESCKNTRNFQE